MRYYHHLKILSRRNINRSKVFEVLVVEAELGRAKVSGFSETRTKILDRGDEALIGLVETNLIDRALPNQQFGGHQGGFASTMYGDRSISAIIAAR